MRTLLQWVSTGAGRIWCRRMHPAPMWPINNHYVCPRCQRQWPVHWQVEHRSAPQQVRQLRPADRRIEVTLQG